MEELNQFIAKILLPEVGSTTRHLQSHSSVEASLSCRAAAQRAISLVTELSEAQKRYDPCTAAATSNSFRSMLQDSNDSSHQQAHGDDVNNSQTEDSQAELLSLGPDLPLADQVGELYVYTASDIRAIAPLWWDYSKKARTFHEKHAEVCFAWSRIVLQSSHDFCLLVSRHLKIGQCRL